MTPSTPGMASAAEVSIDTMRACGCGERSTAMCSMPRHHHVAGISQRARHLARRIDAAHVGADEAAVLRAPPRPAPSPAAAVEHVARQLDRVEDLLIAGAAADVAAEPLLDLLAARRTDWRGSPRSPPSPCRGCNSRTGWRRSCGTPSAARRARPSARAPRPSRCSAPCALATGIRHDFISTPSTNTEQVPHSPAPQPSLVPVRLRSSRRKSSSRWCGLALRATLRPLTVASMRGQA